MIDSAIPTRLRCPRTRPQRMPEGWQPPYPAWSSQAAGGVDALVIGYFGVQWQAGAGDEAALETFAAMRALFALGHGPVFHDLSRCRDDAGYETLLAIAYWAAREEYHAWNERSDVADWWNDTARESGPCGIFREILSPAVTDYEALFSTPGDLHGAASLLGGQSEDTVLEHAYWGSMRDRIPSSQTSELEPADDAALAVTATGARRRVRGHDHVALIRSGQDWSATGGREREIYTTQVEPTLRAGMAYLSGQGREIGCYSNRYLRVMDAQGAVMERSFGVSLWRSLSALEAWAESHETHLAIFNTFQQMAATLDFDLRLRLYHEVMVLAPDEQQYEYINCHARTGLLA